MQTSPPPTLACLPGQEAVSLTAEKNQQGLTQFFRLARIIIKMEAVSFCAHPTTS